MQSLKQSNFEEAAPTKIKPAGAARTSFGEEGEDFSLKDSTHTGAAGTGEIQNQKRTDPSVTDHILGTDLPNFMSDKLFTKPYGLTGNKNVYSSFSSKSCTKTNLHSRQSKPFYNKQLLDSIDCVQGYTVELTQSPYRYQAPKELSFSPKEEEALSLEVEKRRNRQ